MKVKVYLDRVGMGLSLVCALHCLLVPLAFALIPALNVALRSFQSPHRPLAMWLWQAQRYDLALVLTALVLASLSLTLGWRRHRCRRPATWLFASLPLFAYGLSPLPGSWLSHAGSLALAGTCLFGAHASNLRRLSALDASLRGRHAPTGSR